MKTQSERALLWWVLIGALLAFWMGVALMCAEWAKADDTVTMACDPPTHRVQNDDCIQQGTPLTAAEIATLIYTFSYRPKGMGAPWVNVEAPVPTAQVTLTGYGVLYEAVVGARFPGGAILCTSEPLEYRTGPDSSPAGPCSAFTIRK